MDEALRKRAVVVGSREAFVRLASQKLNAAGYAVSLTPVSDAWERIRTEWPNLIVVDPLEPYEAAFALVRKLKANADTAKIPLLMTPPKAEEGVLPWPQVPLP